jgi:hypothetical protein
VSLLIRGFRRSESFDPFLIIDIKLGLIVVSPNKIPFLL